ncbi:UNVERIFIED_CONTAM: hypothetical protein RF653_06685 [Kocuria sp. CPCC 205316]
MPLIRAEETRTEAEGSAHLGERRMRRWREALTALRESTVACAAPEKQE